MFYNDSKIIQSQKYSRYFILCIANRENSKIA